MTAKHNTLLTETSKDNGVTRMHSVMKRPRAPIACYRCHHKKVRCDGVHPNCTRCLSTGVLCAYPSSRRSRNTQPANVDPFIDNLSQLEARIRRIETDLESLRSFAHGSMSDRDSLACRMVKTENDLQESRSIVAQLRLKGEQRAARGRRAAAAAAANADANANANNSSPQKEYKATPIACSIKAKGKLKTVNKKEPKSPSYATPSPLTTYPYPFYFNAPHDFIQPYFPPTLSTNTYPEALSSWPLLNNVSQNPTQDQTLNELVDPMIIAAAIEAEQQQQQQQQNEVPLLSTCLPHEQKTHGTVQDNTLFISGLQPASSTSFEYGQPFYTSFIDNSTL